MPPNEHIILDVFNSYPGIIFILEGNNFISLSNSVSFYQIFISLKRTSGGKFFLMIFGLLRNEYFQVYFSCCLHFIYFPDLSRGNFTPRTTFSPDSTNFPPLSDNNSNFSFSADHSTDRWKYFCSLPLITPSYRWNIAALSRIVFFSNDSVLFWAFPLKLIVPSALNFEMTHNRL